MVACSQGSGGAPNFLGGSSSNTSQNPSGDFGLTALEKPSVQKLIYHVGPVNLMAGQTMEQMFEKPSTLHFQVSEALWVLGFEPKVMDADGKSLPSHLLHKAILFNKHEANPMCASGNGGNPFAIATSTLTKVELPEGFGYPLTPEDPLEAKVIFQNPSTQDYLGVTFSFELTAIPMEKAKGMYDMKAMLLDTDPCDHKPLAIEPGAFVEKSQTFTVPHSGNLMIASGMLSDYGVAVSLTHQNGSQPSLIPFWRAEAKLDETHHIIDLAPNPFIDPSGKKISQGDKLTLGVAFDNFSEEWYNRATGAAMVYIAPAD